MDERDIEKRLLDHVDPNRRSFVRQILGGAAFVAPLIATFSIDSLIAPEEARASNTCSVEDTGYAGPQVYQSHVKSATHATTANGEVMLVIMGNPPGTLSVESAQVSYSIVLPPGTTFEDGHVEFDGNDVAKLDSTNGVIAKKNVNKLCGMAEFLDALDSEGATAVVNVLFGGEGPFKLTGTIKSTGPSIITLGP
jgi:hypothetical protein